MVGRKRRIRSASTFLYHRTLSNRVNSQCYVVNQIHETHAHHITTTNSMFFLVKWRHGGWLKEKRRIRKCFYFSFAGTQLSHHFSVSLLLCILCGFLVDRLRNNVTRPSPSMTLRSTAATIPPATTRGCKPTGRFSGHRKGPVIRVFP